MPVTRNSRAIALVAAVFAALVGCFAFLLVDGRKKDASVSTSGGEAGASSPESPVPQIGGAKTPTQTNVGPRAPSIFDAREDLFATAELILALEGADSLEYAASVARIGEACAAAQSVANFPTDNFGARVPAYDAAQILMERCDRWIGQMGSLPEPRYEISELSARAVAAVPRTADGLGKLPADSPVVRDAAQQIKDGEHASEFMDAAVVWFDANPQARASLISKNRLSDDDFGLAVTLGARLLECEISTSCGPRSFATLEICVHTGCSPGLPYPDALRTSMPPRVATAAFDVRNRLVAIRSTPEGVAPRAP